METVKEQWNIIYDGERTLHECGGRVYESKQKRIEFDPVTLKELVQKEEPTHVLEHPIYTVIEHPITVATPEGTITTTVEVLPIEEPKNPLKCEVCGKICGSTAGKAAHMRAHTRS